MEILPENKKRVERGREEGKKSLSCFQFVILCRNTCVTTAWSWQNKGECQCRGHAARLKDVEGPVHDYDRVTLFGCSAFSLSWPKMANCRCCCAFFHTSTGDDVYWVLILPRLFRVCVCPSLIDSHEFTELKIPLSKYTCMYATKLPADRAYLSWTSSGLFQSSLMDSLTILDLSIHQRIQDWEPCIPKIFRTQCQKPKIWGKVNWYISKP